MAAKHSRHKLKLDSVSGVLRNLSPRFTMKTVVATPPKACLLMFDSTFSIMIHLHSTTMNLNLCYVQPISHRTAWITQQIAQNDDHDQCPQFLLFRIERVPETRWFIQISGHYIDRKSGRQSNRAQFTFAIIVSVDHQFVSSAKVISDHLPPSQLHCAQIRECAVTKWIHSIPGQGGVLGLLQKEWA